MISLLYKSIYWQLNSCCPLYHVCLTTTEIMSSNQLSWRWGQEGLSLAETLCRTDNKKWSQIFVSHHGNILSLSLSFLSILNNPEERVHISLIIKISLKQQLQLFRRLKTYGSNLSWHLGFLWRVCLDKKQEIGLHWIIWLEEMIGMLLMKICNLR